MSFIDGYRKLLRAGLMCGVLCGVATPAWALTFNFTTVVGDTLTTEQASAFSTAAAAWSRVLTDGFTVNLQIGFASLGGTAQGQILGSTLAAFTAFSEASVVQRLTRDETSAADRAAVASLATAAGGSVALTTAQAKAIGYVVGGGSDGIIQFNSDITNFSTSRNADGGIASNTYDLVGIAEHEIGHVLGFQSSFDFTPNADGSFGSPTLLDAYRYTSAAVRASSTGDAYFSLDNGVTDIAGFSTGGANQFQASHWLRGTGGLLDPALAINRVQNITALDITALDVLGYDVAVPEPGSALLLGGGAAALWLRRRRLVQGDRRLQAAAR